MQFVLNSELVGDQDLSADLTLLRFLREQKQLCGTKEGCASGDCGACTVLIGSLDGERIHYETVNACITPVGAAHGKHVVTVEHLSAPEELHPSQTAMVSHHGSQCGFCTPGFVMSLAGLYESRAFSSKPHDVTREDVCEAISGNLCRCTGYRPIVDAGMAMMHHVTASFSSPEVVKRLSAISETDSSVYHQPTSLKELNSLIDADPHAKLIAGGTDLMLEVTQHYKKMPTLIDVSQVKELNICEHNDTEISLGAALTYSHIEKRFENLFPALCQLLKRLGSCQIRNRGTIGGNLGNASPIADIPPILLCLDADVEIGNSNGDTKRLPLEKFNLAYKKTAMMPNEYIIAVHFNAHFLHDFLRFYKISKRLEDDISSVMAAIRFRLDSEKIVEARIAFGGMAAVPVRVTGAEQAFTGQPKNSETALSSALSEIQKFLSPIDDVRASADYRMAMAESLLKKAWLELNGETVPLIDTTGVQHYA